MIREDNHPVQGNVFAVHFPRRVRKTIGWADAARFAWTTKNL